VFCPSLDTIAEGIADAGYVHRLAVDQAWLVTEAVGGVQRGAFERRVVTGTFDYLRILYPALAGYRVAHRAVTFDAAVQGPARIGWRDRKSTRLNSSHVKISYAVFCLKK